MSDTEFDGLLGLLILSAAQKDNHLPSNEPFNPEISGNRYHVTMRCDRFDYLLECLRFDDYNTRADRRKTDNFAPIREVWDLFIAACRSSYKPGSFLTIDEQLLAFRGRCNFRMYIPNKPDKYGLKLVLMCDNATKYMVDAIPYTGKTLNSEGLPQAKFFVKKLSTTCHGSNRNITVDNWFNSVPLATSLLEDPYKLTIVGTLKKNKREIPPEMVHPKNRAIGTSMFCFDGPKTIVSYKAKSSKVVLLLSTCHEKPVIDQVSKKPQIIETYNATKGDILDQIRLNVGLCACSMACIMNIILVIAYVIYVTNVVRTGQKPI
ncbi:piggyBac transposable element-derived protein 4-like [Onthophagus taurus]|uniref:piggyBac transposable element-derived protein 4-like n=1 Tax=Onthophagus taurus TaxID=166361 RepID=UPI0039BE0D6A